MAVAGENPHESALVLLPSLGREVWISSGHEEAACLRAELAVEGDDRAVLVADDVLKLEGQPGELIIATVRALAILGGTVVSVGPSSGDENRRRPPELMHMAENEIRGDR